jgi:hypothetical protein
VGNRSPGDNSDRYPHSPQGYPHRCNYKNVSRLPPALFRRPTPDPDPGSPPPVDNSTSPVDKLQECVSPGDRLRRSNTRICVSAGHSGALDVDKSPSPRAWPGGHAVYTGTSTRVVHSSVELSTGSATGDSTRQQPPRTARIPGCPQHPHPLLLRLSIYMKSFKRKRWWGQASSIVRVLRSLRPTT